LRRRKETHIRIKLFLCKRGGYLLVPAIMALPVEAEHKFGPAVPVREFDSSDLPLSSRKSLEDHLYIWHYAHLSDELGNELNMEDALAK
jgi:hypothetical protein